MRRGLSQAQLGELCGTSKSAINNLEAGNHAPTLGTLRRLAEALRCQPSALLRIFDRRSSRK
jgi:transcriptional regulator with XRE-family HTH domain